jgi:hypothetical protein
VSETQAQEAAGSKAESSSERIAREEAYWDGPHLFGFGLAFLGACIVLIYVLSSI